MIEKKPEVQLEDFLEMHPNLYIILGYFMQYARFNKLPVKITSMFSDIVQGRQSTTHLSGRAVDLSINGWSEQHQKNVVMFVEGRVGMYGAIGKDAKRRCILVHGDVPHFHVQCAP